MQDVRWNDPKTSRYLGKSVPRLDGPGKVTGAAKYTYDMVLPGMLHAKVLRCPHANARVVSIDASAAQRMPGVHAVITDIAGAGRFAGQEIAAVAADTEEIARDAVRAIKIQWEVEPHVVSTRRGMRDERRVGRPREATRGQDPESLWSSAAAVIEEEYYCPVREHLSLETHGLVVQWQDPDRATVWLSTQAVHGSRGELAGALGIPQQNVEVICEVMGGGFGSKFGPGVEGRIAARLSKITGRPVKLMLERYDEQVASGNAPDALMRVKAAMSADGRLIALDSKIWGTPGNGNNSGIPMPYIYNVPNFKTWQAGVSTNTGSARAWRAPDRPPASFLMESVVDELANKLGLDPMRVRQLNQNNQVRNRQLELGAQLIGWENRNKAPGSGTGRYRRGMGCALSEWGGGMGQPCNCDVKIGTDGSVYVGIGTQDLGTGTRTYVGTIVAEDFGLPLSRVKADIGRSSLPVAGGSGGSVTAASVAPAVKDASMKARARFLEAAAGLLNTSAADLELRDAKVVSKSNPANSMTFDQVCAKLPPGGIQVSGTTLASLQQGGVAGAQFVEVEVDTWTGRIQPIKVVAVQDCGYVLNKLTAESQLIGGVIQGLCMALLEDRKMDEPTGRMLNPNMETYKVLGSLEVPEIVPVLYETHDKVAGIGEPAVIPTAAACVNAVYNATGVRLRTLPMTPKRWFEATETNQ